MVVARVVALAPREGRSLVIAPYPCPALLELLGPALDAIALATYAATGGTWPPSTARDLGSVSGLAALALLRVEACACPSDPTQARAWHRYVRADAELDRPLTPHGRAVRGTARPWPGLGQLGDCLCRSSLLFHVDDDHDDDDHDDDVTADAAA